MDINIIFNAYLECALWSSTDKNDQPLDENYFITDINDNSLEVLKIDVVDFVNANKILLEQSALDDEQIGHDFWLSRNRHGAGFWDRGLGNIGEELTEIARVYGSIDLYVGDNGEIYTD